MQSATEQNSQSDAPEPKKDKGQGQSLGQRWLTAVIAIPIVLAWVWFGGWVAFAGALLIVLLCIYELHNMMLHAGYRPLIVVSLGLSVLFLVAAMLPQQQRLLLLECGIGLALLVSFPLLFFRKKLDGALVDWSLTLAIAIYVGWPMSIFLLLRGGGTSGIHGSQVFLPPGAWWLLMVLCGTWGFDAAAFFAGRYFGRHKLAPSISPGKTWEGVLGGIVIAITAGLLFVFRPLNVPWYLAIVLGILLGVADVLGDLAESLIKRQTQVKDSGQLMRGHGGMLDRMDSLLFAVIVVYVFSQLIGG